jgi:type IV secretion system protein VirD4
MRTNIIGTYANTTASQLSQAQSTMDVTATLPGGHAGGDQVHQNQHATGLQATPPLALPGPPAHWQTIATVGVPAGPVAGVGADLGQLGPLVPALAAGAVAAAVAGIIYKASNGGGGGNRKRRGRMVSRRTRLRLRWHPGPGFATRAQLYRHYGKLPARRVARYGRRSLTRRDRWFGPWEEYASRHGKAQGWLHPWGVYSTFEDLCLMIAPPQEGKSQKAAASIVDAPGPVAATSIRGDLIRNTAGLRQQLGQVWIWNPEGVGEYASTMKWNPVAGCEDIVVAVRRAGYMVDASENKGLSDGAFWSDMGTVTLASLMHAAALIHGNMRTVFQWLMERDKAEEPLWIMEEHGTADEYAIATVRHFQQEMTEKTRDGVVTTLSRVLRFMINPTVVEMLSPPAGSGFDFEAFLRSQDTVYLVSSTDGATPTAPLFSAFLAELAAYAQLLGTKWRLPDGTQVARLDPPLSIEGDELGNTAPVPVDRWASWSAGSGIRINMYFQTWARIVERWGDEGARALWSSSKCKIIGAGCTEDDLLRMTSRLIGKVELREADDVHTDRWGQERRRRRYTEVDIISAADIRRLPPGRALVLRSAATSPTIVRLEALRKRRDFKRWRKAGAPVEGLRPVIPREAPRARPELADPARRRHAVPDAVPDEIAARRQRRVPQEAPPLQLPERPAGEQAPMPARPAPAPSPWSRPTVVPPVPHDAPETPAAEQDADQDLDQVPPGWSPWQRRASGSDQ